MDEYQKVIALLKRSNKHSCVNWRVISGPPSSGKTTLLNILSRLGHKTNKDISRLVIEEKLQQGHLINEIYNDGEKLQMEILYRMLKNAFELKPDELIFHDYCLVDNIPFLDFYSIPILPCFEEAANLFRFEKVFICSPLPIEKDGVRLETSQDQKILYDLILNYYRQLGYEPIILPVANIRERLDVILSS